MNILADFQICISTPLQLYKILTSKMILIKNRFGVEKPLRKNALL